ncbi:MAG TPA: ornithine cyclodeaminase family protein [Vicinamibacterales bacterium]|jgi:alanine dehydrogenase|nr:ornithine cyclodeaminase family protein [Vicinamibacterales bacterium]
MPILLSEEDVKGLLTMDDLIEGMEIALADFSARNVTQPVRTVLQVGGRPAFYGLMPAYMPSRPALGTKLVTVFEGNAERGLPTHLATIVLLDPETGALLALMDGRYITEARTAAVSAVSVQWLAREDAASLAIIGSGVQARSHLEAISRVRDIREVRVWSRKRAHVERLISDMSPHIEARLVASDSARAAVEDVDIVVLVTSAVQPVVHADWIADGAHVCAVGACRPTQREMDAALVARGDLYVDSRDAALVEAGDIVLAIKDEAITASHIKAELGEVVGGRMAGRSSLDRVTIFKSLGLAVEDVAAAHLVYQRARERGIGKELTL